MRFPNLRVLLRDIGGILNVLGIVMLVPAIVAYFFKDFVAFEHFLITAICTLTVGIALRCIFKRSYDTELKHAMVCAALSWLIVSAISAHIFVVVGGFGWIDAFFESMSGWTGTGLTVTHPSSLTKTLQFWRSMMQWLGGVGVIVLMVSILGRRPGTGAYALYRAEAREEKIKPSVISTVQTIWWIYLLFTIIGIFILKSAGMSLWESINHAMTAIGTGGFTITDGSISYYDNTIIEIVIVPLMIAGAISFLVHYRFMTGVLPFRRKRGDARAYFVDMQCRTFFLILLILVVAVVGANIFYYGNIIESLRFSSFQTISALTCTGFQTEMRIYEWSESAKLLLAFAMILGGCAGSTAGGVKIWRLMIIYKGISDAIHRTFVPRRAIISHRLGDKVLDDDVMNKILSEAAILILMWLFFIFIGIIVLSFVVPEYTLSDIIFEVCSAQGNVGLSTGISGSSLHPAGKIMLILNMYVGRLEIIPVLMLLRSLIKGFKPL